MAVTATQGNALIQLFGSEKKFKKYLAESFPDDEDEAERHIGNAELMEGYTVHIWSDEGRKQKHYTDSCYGDSGGPLLLKSDQGFQVVGVVNSGFPGNTHSCMPLGTIIGVFGPALKALMRAHQIPFLE